MRLTDDEIKAIKDTFYDVFKDGAIYLFGSRVDDTKRGGDIDLYIELTDKLSDEDIRSKKSKFKLKLYDKIGEQKIDIVVSEDKNRTIEKEASRTGVAL